MPDLLTYLMEQHDLTRADLVPLLGTASRVLRRVEQSPLPVVGACQGLSLAGGLELMMVCDVVFAADTARFGDQHARYGLVPGFGGTQRLPRIVGEARALELIMSGRSVDAAEAERIGLVSNIVSGDPVAAGAAFAKTFTGFSLPTLGFARAAVQRALTVPLQEGLKI